MKLFTSLHLFKAVSAGIVFFVLSLFTHPLVAQIHMEANIDVQDNATNSIEDVKYNYKLERYIVAGQFDDIGTVQRKNVALLTDSLTIAEEIITSINGTVNAVETNDSLIILGGDFTEINGQPRAGLAFFEITSSNTINLLPNDPLQGQSAVVSDIHLTQTKVIILGSFNYTLAGQNRMNILVLELDDLSTSNSIFTDVSIEAFDASTLKINEASTMYVVSGDRVKKGGNTNESSGLKFDYSGNYMGEMTVPDDTHKNGRGLKHVKDNLYSYSRKSTNTLEMVITEVDNPNVYTRNPNPQSAMSGCEGNQIPDKIQEAYNGDVIYVQDYSPTTTILERYSVEKDMVDPTKVNFQSKWCMPVSKSQGPGQSEERKIMAAKNKMFYYEKRMTKLRDKPQMNQGLVAFCLEPVVTEGFENPINDPCEKVRLEYKGPKTKNADGYEWSYTGTGAKIKSKDPGATYQSLDQPVRMDSKDGYLVDIKYEEGFTPGDLKVRAYTICNNRNERIYSTPVQTGIVNNNSSITYSATSDLSAYDCENDQVQLSSSTNIPNASVRWKLQSPTSTWINGSSVTVSSDDYDTTSYVYVAEFLYHSQNGTSCVRRDTVVVDLLDNLPLLSVDNNYLEFDCSNLSLTINGYSQNSTDLVWWNVDDAIEANPVTVDTSDFLNNLLYLIGKDTQSKCLDSIPVTISNDFSLPNAPMINGQAFSQVNPIDELNCNQDTLILTATNYPSQNNTFYWLDDNNQHLDSAILSLNKLSETVHIVGANGCENSFSVFASADTSMLNIDSISDVILTCSYPEMLVIHPESDGNGLNGWDGLGNQDSLLVTSPGQYTYNYYNPSNGCQGQDVLAVNFNAEIDIDITTPNYVCLGEEFTIDAIAIGILAPNYYWSIGGQASHTTGIGGIDEVISIVVTDTNGCIGYDTISLNLAPEIFTNVYAVQSCDGKTAILNGVVSSGGIGPFSYSLDGDSFGNSNVFADLTQGDYTLYVQDLTGCIYDFDITITDTTGLPDLKFLASTFNKPNDLVALVNVSEFNGFDNVYWTLPPELNFEYETDSARFISATDTGYYDITLSGVLGECTYDYTKEIYFGSLDTVSFYMDESMGIQSINVYPNPTTGIFDVEVTFGVDQNYMTYVSDMSGIVVSNTEQGFGATLTRTIDISPQASGNFILRIISEYDNAYVTIIKQ